MSIPDVTWIVTSRTFLASDHLTTPESRRTAALPPTSVPRELPAHEVGMDRRDQVTVTDHVLADGAEDESHGFPAELGDDQGMAVRIPDRPCHQVVALLVTVGDVPETGFRMQLE